MLSHWRPLEALQCLREHMVDFNTWISLGMEQCAPSGAGTQDERREIFAGLVEGWNEEKDAISDMSESEVRSSLTCP